MFTKTFYLLQNEGHLIRACISAGLTDLRNADYAQGRGRFYAGFFHLANGIERLLKVTLILDHMADHRLEAPSIRSVKKLSHDLESLTEHVLALTSSPTVSALGGKSNPTLERKILEFLSLFAKRARYYNLDTLTSGAKFADPLSEWMSLLNEVVAEDVPERARARVRYKAEVVEILLEPHTLVTQSGLDGQPLSVRSGSELTGLMELAQKYATVRVFRMMSPLVESFIDATDRAQNQNFRNSSNQASIPYMAEFVDFLRVEERYFKTRKRWS